MSAWYDIVRDGPRWRVCRCTNPLDAPGRLATVTVEMYTHRDAAIIRARSLNATAEGLRRLGMAVAIWGAMAAERERATGVVVLADMQAQRMRRIASTLTDLLGKARCDLAAERAARRKWELRLRARAADRKRKTLHYYGYDLLRWRQGRIKAGQSPKDWGTPWWISRPIAGPRGVLP